MPSRRPGSAAPESSGARIALGLVAALGIAGIALAERRRPLRRQRHPALPRTIRNVAMGAMCAAVVATIETPATRVVAHTNIDRRRGLAHLVPRPFGGIAAFLAMDYGFYLWHVATHRVGFLWRFHRVHHVDPDMDMSTAIRFHMVDMIVSLPWRLVQVRLSGIGPRGLERWQRFFTASILFHHSNLALPRALDDRLAWVLTTPRMHGIHHATVRRLRNSNWSSGISVWDRLHGSFRVAPDTAPGPRDIVIGVDDPLAMADVAIEQALAAPFVHATYPGDVTA